MKKILFITGTDTGVGKTLFTALLLHHLRQKGGKTLAMKPFCSGGRGDARLLESLQRGDATLDEINPFYFPKPQAPWVAEHPIPRSADWQSAVSPVGNRLAAIRPHGQELAHVPSQLTPKKILDAIRTQMKRCDTLLIEGSGGIFVPLTAKLLVADLIAKLACAAIVIAPDRLGTINHTLLTVRGLHAAGVKEVAVVLMAVEQADISTKTNETTLRHFLPQIPLFRLPFLGAGASKTGAIKKNAKKMQKTLDQIRERVNFIPF